MRDTSTCIRVKRDWHRALPIQAHLTAGEPTTPRRTSVPSEPGKAACDPDDERWEWDLRTDEVRFTRGWMMILGLGGETRSWRFADWLERIHPEDRDRFEAEKLAHLDGRIPSFECEYRVRHESGGYRWIYCEGRAMRDADGIVQRMYGTQREVSARHDGAAPSARDAEPRVKETAKTGARTGASATASPAGSGGRAAAGGSETIMVVEDNDVVRMVVTEVLSSRGYRVLQASNGEDALDLARDLEKPVDLLLSDVMMPRMGGPELARRFNDLHPATLLLFMSGYRDRTEDLDGSAPFLPKPFAPQDLIDKVREVLTATASGGGGRGPSSAGGRRPRPGRSTRTAPRRSARLWQQLA